MEKILYLESCYISCENSKFLASVIEDSVITCDKIIEETKATLTKKFQQKPSQQILTKSGKL